MNQLHIQNQYQYSKLLCASIIKYIDEFDDKISNLEDYCDLIIELCEKDLCEMKLKLKNKLFDKAIREGIEFESQSLKKYFNNSMQQLSYSIDDNQTVQLLKFLWIILILIIEYHRDLVYTFDKQQIIEILENFIDHKNVEIFRLAENLYTYIDNQFLIYIQMTQSDKVLYVQQILDSEDIESMNQAQIQQLNEQESKQIFLLLFNIIKEKNEYYQKQILALQLLEKLLLSSQSKLINLFLDCSLWEMIQVQYRNYVYYQTKDNKNQKYFIQLKNTLQKLKDKLGKDTSGRETPFSKAISVIDDNNQEKKCAQTTRLIFLISILQHDQPQTFIDLKKQLQKMRNSTFLQNDIETLKLIQKFINRNDKLQTYLEKQTITLKEQFYIKERFYKYSEKYFLYQYVDKYDYQLFQQIYILEKSRNKILFRKSQLVNQHHVQNMDKNKNPPAFQELFKQKIQSNNNQQKFNKDIEKANQQQKDVKLNSSQDYNDNFFQYIRKVFVSPKQSIKEYQDQNIQDNYQEIQIGNENKKYQSERQHVQYQSKESKKSNLSSRNVQLEQNKQSNQIYNQQLYYTPSRDFETSQKNLYSTQKDQEHRNSSKIIDKNFSYQLDNNSLIENQQQKISNIGQSNGFYQNQASIDKYINTNQYYEQSLNSLSEMKNTQQLQQISEFQGITCQNLNDQEKTPRFPAEDEIIKKDIDNTNIIVQKEMFGETLQSEHFQTQKFQNYKIFEQQRDDKFKKAQNMHYKDQYVYPKKEFINLYMDKKDQVDQMKAFAFLEKLQLYKDDNIKVGLKTKFIKHQHYQHKKQLELTFFKTSFQDVQDLKIQVFSDQNNFVCETQTNHLVMYVKDFKYFNFKYNCILSYFVLQKYKKVKKNILVPITKFMLQHKKHINRNLNPESYIFSQISQKFDLDTKFFKSIKEIWFVFSNFIKNNQQQLIGLIEIPTLVNSIFVQIEVFEQHLCQITLKYKNEVYKDLMRNMIEEMMILFGKYVYQQLIYTTKISLNK